MSWTLRAAAHDDIPRMQRVEVDAGKRFAGIGFDAIAGDDPPEPATLAAHVDAATAWIVDEAASVGQDVIRALGYAIASIVDGEGHLDQISVIDGASGRGIGAGLMEVVEAWARARGLETITLTTYRDVVWNGPFYARLGYVGLEHESLGPELTAIRIAEIDAGIDSFGFRWAMRKSVTGGRHVER